MSNAESHPETPASATADARQSSHNSGFRNLFLFIAADRTFAIFADQIEGTAEAKVPARLPRAPDAILGVVCVRGRMLTVFDPMALLTGEPLTWQKTLPCVIALRGDEQLALAAQGCLDPIKIADEEIQRTNEDSGSFIFGTARHRGQDIVVLDTNRLFGAAMQQRDRRRRRF
jgi:chemotaxis signal transduction protein